MAGPSNQMPAGSGMVETAIVRSDAAVGLPAVTRTATPDATANRACEPGSALIHQVSDNSSSISRQNLLAPLPQCTNAPKYNVPSPVQAFV